MIKPIRIRVEYLKGSGVYPTVLDIRKPQITWNVEGTKVQTAYQVCASGSKGTYYDSGIVESREMRCILDAEFQSRELIQVEVRLWGEAQDQEQRECVPEEKGIVSSETISFEMGLLKPEDWNARWINPEETIPDKGKERPASYVKRHFQLDKKPEKARLYATAHGIYQLFLNGQEVKGAVLAPGTSEYVQRLQYQTYDVAEFLKEGENTLLAVIGNGWWRGTVTYDGVKNGYGEEIALLVQLEAEGESVCVTDADWRATQEGPIRDTDLMMGEIYNAERENMFSNPEAWHPVTIAEFGFDNLVCSNCPPVLEHECFQPKLIESPKGEMILDFGQNLAGYLEFDTEGKAGETWKFTHGETLDADGNFCNSNFQSTNFYCAQEITYRVKEGMNHFKAFGTFMGFRYVKVEGMSKINPEAFCAHAVYSDLEILTEFHCGNELVNQLFHNALWSIKGNLIDLPTDCPTREKSGFTGDLVTYIHTFQYLMEAYPMVRKFIENQAASQGENGCVKQIVADCRPMGAIDGAAGWSDSFEILPWKLGQRYNDYCVLDENYEKIGKWMHFCIDRAASETKPENEKKPWKEYLYDSGFHWGEWAEPELDGMEELMYSGTHGNPEVATAYLAQGCKILAKEAKRLGKENDSKAYRKVAEGVKKAYREAFLTDGVPVSAGYERWKEAGGSAQWGNNTDVFSAVLHEPKKFPETEKPSKRMCRYIRPVVLNLVREDEKQALVDQLDQLVRENEYRLNTGFLTTHELCRTLSDYGHVETAYRLLLNERCPGWLYSVKHGATTVPENWNAYGEDGSRNASFNHYSYGSVVGWLMDTAAGIRLKDGKIRIEPKTSRELGFVTCSYQSPFGKIESSWRYEGDQVHCQIQIPDNCKAEICLENGERMVAGPGVHQYVYEKEAM